MADHGLARAPTRRAVFFGWKVVGAAFVVAVFGWGLAFYGPPVFLHALHETRGWPVSLIGAAITTHFLVGAGLVVYLSDIHRRWGIAATTRAGALALALGIGAWALATQPWQLFAAALVSGAGWAATSGAAIAAMVGPWFKRRLGRALSLAFNGGSAGGILFTPLWVAAIDRLGFAAAAALAGIATLVVVWPLAGRYLRPTPERLGLAPDGDDAGAAPLPQATGAPITRRALLRDRRFVTLSGAAAPAMIAQIGLLALLVARLAGPLGDAGAAGAVSLMTACAIVGRLLVGLLPADMTWRRVASANVLVQACGVLLLWRGETAPLLLAGCALVGLGFGNLISIPPLIAQAEFERVDVGRVIALVTAINQALFSLAPGAFGALFDRTGGYGAPLLAAVGLQTLSAAIVLLGGQSGRVRRRARPAPGDRAGPRAPR